MGQTLLGFVLLAQLVYLLYAFVQGFIQVLVPVPVQVCLQLENYDFYHRLIFRSRPWTVFANRQKQVWSVLVPLFGVSVFEVVMEDVLYVCLSQLETTQFEHVILRVVLVLLLVVKQPDLNVMWTCWPDVKILKVSQLLYEYWWSAHFDFPVLV